SQHSPQKVQILCCAVGITPVSSSLERWSQERSEGIALITPESSYSWSELYQRASEIAWTLDAQGISRGDVVGLELPAGVDSVAVLHACLLIGASAMPIDIRLADSELDALRAKAKCVIDCTTELGNQIGGALPATRRLATASTGTAETRRVATASTGTTETDV